MLSLNIFPAVCAGSSTQKPGTHDAKEITKYLNLRMDYSKSLEYNPYNSEMRGIMGKCNKLMDEDKFNEAIEEAKAGLKMDKYNIQLLVCLASAYRKIGDIENADNYRKLWTGLASSILAGGDGKSEKSAFTVISVDEEYAVLDVLGLRRVKQRLVTIDDKNFDILEVKGRDTDKTFELYFNIDIPFKWLAKKLESAK